MNILENKDIEFNKESNFETVLTSFLPKGYTGKEINDLQEFIVMKTADDNLVPWLASQTDMLAEDWIFAEGE